MLDANEDGDDKIDTWYDVIVICNTMKFQTWIAKRRIKPVRSCWHSGGETPLDTATRMGSECHACDDKIIGIRRITGGLCFFLGKKYTNPQGWQKPLLLCMVQLLVDVETTDWRFVTTCFICHMMRTEVAPIVTSICLRGGVTSMWCCVSGCFSMSPKVI